MKKITTLTLLFVSTLIFGQTDQQLVEKTVNKNTLKGHIYFLADDLLKGRATGTPENKIAAAYLANTLRSYGVKPNPKTDTYYQEVVLEKKAPPTVFKLSINGQEIRDKVILDANKTTFNGQTVYLNFGLEDDYNGQDLTGKVIIAKAGGPEAKDARAAFGLRETKKGLAQKAGAIGLIELLDAKENMWGFIEHNFNEPSLSIAKLNDKKETIKKTNIAYTWVLDKEGAMVKDLATKRGIVVELEMNEETTTKVISQNVIGVVEGTDAKLKNEYIIYSGHYDHVGIGTPDETGDTIYNGARDNAVGVTTVLSMAENLAKYPTKRSALFILFTGEEKGLLGSEYYVANPVLPLNQMVYCFNSDNGGYNDTSLVTIIGLPRTTAGHHIKNAAVANGLTAVDDPAPEQGLFDRSDNVHFAKAGIPAPTFSLGFTAFDNELTKYYHRPADEADSLDYDYLYKFFKAYVASGRAIANDPATPTWTSGDKYEEASNKLYNKMKKQ